MSTAAHSQPFIYVGPSLSRQECQQMFPGANVCPPVARDDLYRAREAGVGVFLLIDGIFAHQLAVSPREVIDVAQDGAVVIGAASMGALRAAECWPLGVRGVGLIYRMYRLGLLDSDDDVAVVTNPDREFCAVSDALVNIRYAMSKALRARLLSREAALDVLRVAEGLSFSERRWSFLFKRMSDPHGHLERFCRGLDLKKRDAQQAVNLLARLVREQPGLASHHPRRSASPFTRTERYRGHDRLVGLAEETLRRELTTWLFATGRYQKFVWSLVMGEPELRDVPVGPGRPEVLRDRLAETLARLLRDLDSFATRVWAELEFLDELDAEIMRWHAIQDLARSAQNLGLKPEASVDRRVGDELAIAHGVRDWEMLAESVVGGHLFGAIPMAWIEDARSRLGAVCLYGDSYNQLSLHESRVSRVLQDGGINEAAV